MDNFAFLLPVTMTLFGLVFVAIGWSGQATARAWGAAFLLGAAGFLAPILPVPNTFQALFGDAVFLASFYYYGEALLRHFAAPRIPTARIVFALFSYAGAIVAIVGLASLPLELAISDVSTSLLLGVPLAMVFWRAHSLVDRVLVLVSAVVVVDIIVRFFIFTVLIGLSPEIEAFANSGYAFYQQVSVGVLSVCFALSALGSVIFRTLESYRTAAERDPLTGLFNRRGFDAALAAIPAADQRNCVVLSVDIDHFKQVNDRFGHAAGDLVLIGLADLLRRHLPQDAIIARFGGEEFVALLPNLPLAGASALAQFVRAEFARHDWQPAGVEGPVTLCAGLAAVSGAPSTLHEAMSRADRALYAAKSGGRNQVVIDAGETYVQGLRAV